MYYVFMVKTAKNPVSYKETSSIALKAFFSLAEKWELNREQAMILLGITSTSTYANWKKGQAGILPKDTLERISYLLGIHKSLRILFSRSTESVYQWVRSPNTHPFFSGKSALERMLSGNVADLYIVRQYLDAQRGGWS